MKLNREKIYRQWLQKRREVVSGAEMADQVMARLDEPPPAMAVPPQPPAPAPDAWPEGLARIAAAAGLVGLGLFRMAYVSFSLLAP
mgnify:CR=1 FL=1